MVLNTTSGIPTQLADNNSITRSMPGLAMNSDNIFTMEGDDDSLASVNPTTGVATLIGSGVGSSCCGNGMTFDQSDTLFLGGGSNLYSVNTSTGAGTLIGAFTSSGFTTTPSSSYYLVSMSTRPSDGTIFGLLKRTGSGSTEPSFLVTVNTATAEVTYVGETNGRYDGLVFVPSTLFPPP